MKLKIMIVSFLFFMLVISVLGIFNLPPFAFFQPGLSSSGYFRNIDKKYEVIVDSFIGIKISSRPDYAWIFIDEIEKKHNLKIEIFNNRGEQVSMPGFYNDLIDRQAASVINSKLDKGLTFVDKGIYERIIPVKAEKRCAFCHRKEKEGDFIGVLKFQEKHESLVYYSHERSLFFLMLSFVIIIVLIQVARWHPYGGVKELFDK